MTMQHPVHPDDERLAALAGDDPEATGDGRLAEHVAGCERCIGVVDELRSLRASLAELPDLRPSRPIQLLPPVPAGPSIDGGSFGFLRRLAAPAMVAGAGLAIVGAVGLGGTVLGAMSASAGASAPDTLDGRGGAEFEATSQAPATAEDPAQPADEQQRDGGEERALIAVDLSTPGGWAVILLAGIALMVAGLSVRFSIQPRAG
jgi:hypothetical protein